MRAVNSMVLCAILALSACKSEQEILDSLQPGRDATEMVSKVLAASHILHHFILPYQTKYLPKHVPLRFTDSTTTDGDGFGYAIQFGNSTLLPDGLLYQGRLIIRVGDTTASYSDTGMIQFNVGDSFAIRVPTGWEYFTGYIRWQGKTADSALLSVFLEVKNVYGTKTIQMQSQPILLVRTGSLNNYIHGLIFNGSFNCSDASKAHTVLAKSLEQLPGCYSNWSKGMLEVQDQAGTKWTANMNPFGNEACDNSFKVSKKEKNTTREAVFKAWN